MSLPGRKININGINYHVSDQGDSDKAVLLMHGMPDTSSAWKYQTPALLETGFRVIAPDMIGYGQTDKPEDVRRYAVEQSITDMISLVENLGLKTLDVVGHDWGSAVSWGLVSYRPDLFRRHITLQVGHPACFADISPETAKENWYMYLHTQEKAAELFLLNDCEFCRNITMKTHPEIDEVVERLKQPDAMDGFLNWDRANQVASMYLEIMSGEAAYEKCRVPTMGIYSAGDVYLWEEQMAKSGEFMDAEWRFERLEKGSHWVMLDNHEEVNPLMLDWLGQ